MTGISRTSLFGKLNRLAYQTIENATKFCRRRGNPFVELVHWFHQILNLQDSDLHRIIKHFDLNPSNVARDLTKALNRLPPASSSVLNFSAHVEETIEMGCDMETPFLSGVHTGYYRHIFISPNVSCVFENRKLDALWKIIWLDCENTT